MVHNGFYCLKNKIEINDGEHDLEIWGIEAGIITAFKFDGELFVREKDNGQEIKLTEDGPAKNEHNFRAPFKQNKKITTIKGVPIWQPITDYIMGELDTSFTFDDVCNWMNKYYADVLKRDVKPATIDRYACGYVEFMLKNSQIEEINDREYRKASPGAKVDLVKQGRIPNLIKWIIEKNVKVFDLEDFYKAYPTSRRNFQRTEKVIHDLITEHKLIQIGKDRFRLNTHNNFRVTDS